MWVLGSILRWPGNPKKGFFCFSMAPPARNFRRILMERSQNSSDEKTCPGRAFGMYLNREKYEPFISHIQLFWYIQIELAAWGTVIAMVYGFSMGLVYDLDALTMCKKKQKNLSRKSRISLSQKAVQSRIGFDTRLNTTAEC